MEKFYCICGYIAIALVCILMLYFVFNCIIVLIIDKKRQKLKILSDIKDLQFNINKYRYEFTMYKGDINKALHKHNELLIDLIKVISKKNKD